DHEPDHPAAAAEQQRERVHPPPPGQRGHGRRRMVLLDPAPVQRRRRAERKHQSRRQVHGRGPWNGRYASAVSAATPTRGRSRRRSNTTKRRSQRGANLRLNASRLSSWKCPFSESRARFCTRSSPFRSASGASRAANGAKFSDTYAKPWSRPQPIASQISHSLKPFGVSRRRGIEDSESADAPCDTAKCRKPAAAPSGPKPTTNTASSSPSRNSVSSA